MAEVHQLVPPPRPYLATRPWRGPEGGNIVILPCIRRERLSDHRSMTMEERCMALRAVALAQDEHSA